MSSKRKNKVRKISYSIKNTTRNEEVIVAADVVSNNTGKMIRMSRIGQKLVDLLTTYDFPPPEPLAVEELNMLRNKQLLHSRLLRLPRELLDEITSYVTPTSLDAVHFRTPHGIACAADLASLALTCRFLFAVFYPSLHHVLKGRAVAPWAGDTIQISHTCSAPMYASALDFSFQDRVSGSALPQILRRLNGHAGDWRTRRDITLQVFRRDILGLDEDQAGRQARVALRNHTMKQYVLNHKLEAAGLYSSLGNLVPLPGLWTSCEDFDRFDETISSFQFDIKAVNGWELIGWEDISERAVHELRILRIFEVDAGETIDPELLAVALE